MGFGKVSLNTMLGIQVVKVYAGNAFVEGLHRSVVNTIQQNKGDAIRS